jgi:hypothetical protein
VAVQSSAKHDFKNFKKVVSMRCRGDTNLLSTLRLYSIEMDRYVSVKTRLRTLESETWRIT